MIKQRQSILNRNVAICNKLLVYLKMGWKSFSECLSNSNDIHDEIKRKIVIVSVFILFAFRKCIQNFSVNNFESCHLEGRGGRTTVWILGRFVVRMEGGWQ